MEIYRFRKFNVSYWSYLYCPLVASYLIAHEKIIKRDITGDTQTGPCRRQFILFWIGIGVFTFVEKGKQQEEKKKKKKTAIVTEFTNVHSTLMLLPLPPFSRPYHLVRCAKHFRLMICNSCSVISYLGFSWVFPRKNGSLRSFRV